MSALPAWLQSFSRGYAVLGIKAGQSPPSYSLGPDELNLAAKLTAALQQAAAAVEASPPEVVKKLEAAPNPEGVIRRIVARQRHGTTVR